MATDLEIAFKALRAKQAPHTLNWSYYDGDQPLMYTAKRLENVFRGLDARFVQNWCAVVIDACNERINLSGFTVAQPDLQERANDLFTEQELNLESDEAHLAMLVTGEAYFIVWKNEEEARLQAYFNDPRLCYVHYRADDPRQKLWAAKWWQGDNKKLNLTLYYPDRLEHYKTRKNAENVGAVADFHPEELVVEENPYGRVPVFHFRTQKRKLKSDLFNVIPLQNGVNKLLTDMMVAAEFGAFKQRWIISNAENLGKLKNAPNENWLVPAGDGTGQQTSVGQFEAEDLSNFLKSIDAVANSIAAISRTPKHFFFSQVGDPSGEALIALEAPLVKKAQDRIDRVGPVWREVMAFLLELDGTPVALKDITPRFDDPRTVLPVTQASIRQANTQAGIPIATTMREFDGWEQNKIDAMLADKQAEAELETTSLGEALAKQERLARQNAVVGEE